MSGHLSWIFQDISAVPVKNIINRISPIWQQLNNQTATLQPSEKRRKN